MFCDPTGKEFSWDLFWQHVLPPITAYILMWYCLPQVLASRALYNWVSNIASEYNLFFEKSVTGHNGTDTLTAIYDYTFNEFEIKNIIVSEDPGLSQSKGFWAQLLDGGAEIAYVNGYGYKPTNIQWKTRIIDRGRTIMVKIKFTAVDNGFAQDPSYYCWELLRDFDNGTLETERLYPVNNY